MSATWRRGSLRPVTTVSSLPRCAAGCSIRRRSPRSCRSSTDFSIVCINSFSVLADGELEQLLRALELAHELDSLLVKVFGGEGDDRIRRARRAPSSSPSRGWPSSASRSWSKRTTASAGPGTPPGLLRSTLGASVRFGTSRTASLPESTSPRTTARSATGSATFTLKEAVCRAGDGRRVELDGEAALGQLVAGWRGPNSYRGYLSYDYEKHWHDDSLRSRPPRFLVPPRSCGT